MANFGVYMSSGSGAVALNWKFVRKFLYLDTSKSNQTSHFFIFLYLLNFGEGNSGLVQGLVLRLQTVKDECEPLVRVMSEWCKNMIKCAKMRVKVR